MSELAIILSTLLPALITPGAPPSVSNRRPAAITRAAIETPPDPCQGRSRVEGLASPYDDELHTCVCSPIHDLRGVLVRVEVRCW